jgi:hypothetical protein
VVKTTRRTDRSVEIAHHEAGHAVIARALGVGVVYVAMFATSDDNRANAKSVSASYKARDAETPALLAALKIDATVALAGPYAQHRFRPRAVKQLMRGGEGDCQRALGCLVHAVRLERQGVRPLAQSGFIEISRDVLDEAKARFQNLEDEVAALVARHWPAIERVAAALLECPLLSEADVDALARIERTIKATGRN